MFWEDKTHQGATQVPLEGKQRRGLLQGMIIEWNRDWIGSSCHCQTHRQVDDSSPRASRVCLVRREQPVWMALCSFFFPVLSVSKWVITIHGQLRKYSRIWENKDIVIALPKLRGECTHKLYEMNIWIRYFNLYFLITFQTETFLR